MSIPNVEASRGLGLPWRFGLLTSAVAATIGANWQAANLLGLGFFPSGLLSFMFGDSPHVGIFPFLCSWILYFLLVFSAFWVQNKRTFFLVFAVLCGVLIVNTVGCHQMTEHAFR
jgi:hypothetical protein